ncbi:uncharacterized protein TNIN_315831 [Trichonephila inaurata madagascariensis]|uniref:Uncharacterized protein n=1 Tax=Trichonephila inaurata madagascariensis TaxID=2747483 RepID=A0A8X7BPE5_9ARAC|nr:uncharacterized protein TNIN_315831 [Trichonephila inaurata madagascariensis]
MLRELYMKTADDELKKSKKSGIICTCNLQEFELMCYESIDILQAPRLVNNPFAYAYTQKHLSVGRIFVYESDGTSIKHFSHLHAFKCHRDQNKNSLRKSRKTITLNRNYNQNL